MLRKCERTKFMVALASAADVDFQTVRHIVDNRELDGLAILCKAAGYDRALFLTVGVLILDGGAEPLARAREYGELYTELPKSAAVHTLRFWRMRQRSGSLAA